MKLTDVKLWKPKTDKSNAPLVSGYIEFDNILRVRVAVFASKKEDSEYFVSFPSKKVGDKWYDDVQFLDDTFAKDVRRAVLDKTRSVLGRNQQTDLGVPQQAQAAPAQEEEMEEIPF